LTLRNLFRIIRRDTLTLITNITGLSLGLAASILLTVFIQFELSFDRHFSKGDQIYRLNSIWIEDGEPGEMPINLRQAYTEIPGNVPGVEAAIQLYRGFEREITEGENRFKELNLIYTDPDFFQLFDFKVLYGEAESALREPGQVVLPEKIAFRIYGKADAVGETFTMEERVFTVSAVMENIPPNTHFNFDMLMPMQAEPELEQLGGLEFFTYYLLQQGMDHASVLETLKQENSRLLTERFLNFEGSRFDSRLEALNRLHLQTHVKWDLTTPGSIKTIGIMLIITMAIMGLALTNFINLYILNGAKRSREIGIRKVNGAGRRQMIQQFYLETTAVVSLAFVLGIVLASFLLPSFAKVMQRESFTEVTSTPGLYLVLAVIYLITIFLSGLYPALLLSRAAPIPLIRGAVNPAGDKRTLLRVVTVLQVCIAVCLLTILLGINTQIRYLKNYNPGYNPEHVVQISNLNQGLTQNYPALKDRLLSHSEVLEVSASSHYIGRGTSGQGIRIYGDDPDQVRSINEYRIYPGLCKLYQFKLLAGRFLDPDREPDRAGVILNEGAARLLNRTPGELIGTQLIMHSDPLEVIGVVEDFHYSSAARSIEPLVFTAYATSIRNISVRYAPGSDPQQVLQTIHETMLDFDPAYVMLHNYPTETIQSYYSSEERLQKILLSGSLLSVLIVLLGIYALVSHQIVSRTKEIGIRKVMGGSTGEMMSLIYTSTLKWTGIASVLAIPLSLLYLREWLSNYAVRITAYGWIFASSILLVVVFQTLLTLGQTRKTARRNPVEGLRYE